MKVIFLDIDGVINNHKSLCRHIHLDNELCQLVTRIVACTGAVIVISSDWRIMNTVESLQEQLFNAGVSARIIDKTDTKGIIRGEEIQRWLDKHPEVESYVIIDDMCDMLHNQMGNFVRTCGRYGITEEDTDKAIEILGPLPNICCRCRGFGWIDISGDLERCSYCFGKRLITK